MTVRFTDISELHFTKRAGRRLGAVLGTVGGLAAGVVLAFSIGSSGHDGAAVATLITAPVAGGLVGARLSADVVWERVVVRPVGDQAGRAERQRPPIPGFGKRRPCGEGGI